MLLLAVVIGLLIGLSLGALGGGGSILTVPALVYLLRQSPHQATAASLLVVGIAAVTGAVTHARAGRVRFGAGVVFGLLGIAGSYAGSRVSAAVPARVLLAGFSLLMLAAAGAMIARRKQAPGSRVPPTRLIDGYKRRILPITSVLVTPPRTGAGAGRVGLEIPLRVGPAIPAIPAAAPFALAGTAPARPGLPACPVSAGSRGPAGDPMPAAGRCRASSAAPANGAAPASSAAPASGNGLAAGPAPASSGNGLAAGPAPASSSNGLAAGPAPAGSGPPDHQHLASGPGTAGSGAAAGTRGAGWRRLASGWRSRAGRPVLIAAAATAVGFLTGFFGVGGGFLVVPVLVLLLGFDMALAAGTSLVVIAIDGAAALAARAGHGLLSLDWPLIGAFAGAAVVGALAGGRLAGKVSPHRLTAAFTALIVAVGCYTLARSIPGLVL